MPLPKPRKNEKEDDFISRCMSNDTMKKEFPDNDQRLAVCYQKWEDKGKKKKGEAPNRDYSHIVSAVYGTVWAIMPEKLEAILDFVDLKASGLQVNVEQIEAAQASRVTGRRQTAGKIAILPLFGIISHRMNMLTAFSGGTSTDLFGAAFDEALNDKEVESILIDVDSPGGSVYGVHELSEKIYKGRRKKRILAAINSLGASAAYWIASAANEIVMTPGGEAGSVGVIAIHTDVSGAEKQAGIKRTFVKAGKYKAEGNPHEPLDDEGLAYIQSRVDDYYEMMTQGIARNRGVTVTKVKTGFGEGRVVGAKQAYEMGIIDRIGTLEQAYKMLHPPSKEKLAAMDERINKWRA